jgi:translation initiation factor RLI1
MDMKHTMSRIKLEVEQCHIENVEVVGIVGGTATVK